MDDKGAMMGIMSSDRALGLARGRGLDLVEIAPHAKPPTCKIIDYGKWKFKLSKKEKHSRKNQIKIVVKEVQIRPRTDVHDLEIKMKKARAFLMNGCKVKIHLRYSGREMAHKELGIKMLNKVIERLKDCSVLEKDKPQMEKRSAFLFFAPNPTQIKELQKKKKKPASLSGGTKSSDTKSSGGTKSKKGSSGEKSGAGEKGGSDESGGGSSTPPVVGSGGGVSSGGSVAGGVSGSVPGGRDDSHSSGGTMDSVAQGAVPSSSSPPSPPFP